MNNPHPSLKDRVALADWLLERTKDRMKHSKGRVGYRCSPFELDVMQRVLEVLGYE